MKNISQLVRPNILSLKPYSSARDEFKGEEGIFLDANENPFGHLNRYPDPLQKSLKNKLSLIKNIATENIFIGNGSDEIIDLLLRIFCQPEKDKIIICPPTYGMYEVSANINSVEIINIPLDNNFQLEVEKIISNQSAKLIFLCSPNNPTGNILKEIEPVLQSFNGIVVIDEAYIDFSDSPSFIHKLSDYPNLVVMQTLSKCWGLAAARLGLAFASTEIINLMNKVKPPYNISKLNQDAAMAVLSDIDNFQAQKKIILEQREYLKKELLAIKSVIKIYPSDANFLLLEVSDANAMYNALVDKKIIIRNRHSVVNNCIRISIGTAQENQALLQAMRELDSYQ